jgi:uncharacterized protein (TIGR02266 family)
MSYSGAEQARAARESLGQALQALQQDPNIPEDVMAVAQNIAQSVGALFEAEKATSEPDGKSCVKNALGSLSQTLALLQDVRSKHPGIGVATEVIAKTMSVLYPLTTVPSKAPPAMGDGAQTVKDPKPPVQPHSPPSMAPPSAPASTGPRVDLEANIGATTESNFYVGFSGEIADGGVFVSTYEVLAKNTSVKVLVTLPGNFEFHAMGWVRFVRDPFDMNSEAEPGMGVQFESLDAKARELVLRFVRKRPPMFYED